MLFCVWEKDAWCVTTKELNVSRDEDYDAFECSYFYVRFTDSKLLRMRTYSSKKRCADYR
jgi:hypothetical protein